MFGKQRWQEKGVVIKNAVCLLQYSFSALNRSRLRNELGFPENNTLFLFIGNLYAVKNPYFMLDVFAEFVQADHNARLVICGENLMGSKLIEYLHKKNIQDQILLLGSCDDVTPFYSAADILLFPSLAEGLPFAVVEAQASGLPCLISDRITEEVVLLDTTVRYPLEKGVTQWAQKAHEILTNGRFCETAEELKKAGYDISSASKQLEKYYLEPKQTQL